MDKSTLILQLRLLTQRAGNIIKKRTSLIIDPVWRFIKCAAPHLFWLILPIMLFATTIILKWAIPEHQLWHFYADVAISATLIIYAITYCLQSTNRMKRIVNCAILLQIPIVLLYMLELSGGSYLNIAWAQDLITWLNKSPDAIYITAVINGVCTTYVFVLGSQSTSNLDNSTDDFRWMTLITGILTPIVTLAVFSAQSVYQIGETLRPALTFSSLLISALCFSLGGFIGSAKNYAPLYLGGAAMFSLGITFGVGVLPFSGGAGIKFPAILAFWPNLLLLSGVIAALITDQQCYLSMILHKVLGHKRDCLPDR